MVLRGKTHGGNDVGRVAVMRFKVLELHIQVSMLAWVLLATTVLPANAIGFGVTWDQELFQSLYNQGKYDEAFNILMQPDLEPSFELFRDRGFLRGSGLLSSEFDLCATVLDLERAYALGGEYLLGALDFLYDGDWSSIAALEGNPDAMMNVGVRLLNSKIESNPFLVYDKEVAAKAAYNYIYNGVNSDITTEFSDIINYQLEKIPSDWPYIDFTLFQARIELQQIKCPI